MLIDNWYLNRQSRAFIAPGAVPGVVQKPVGKGIPPSPSPPKLKAATAHATPDATLPRALKCNRNDSAVQPGVDL